MQIFSGKKRKWTLPLFSVWKERLLYRCISPYNCTYFVYFSCETAYLYNFLLMESNKAKENSFRFCLFIFLTWSFLFNYIILKKRSDNFFFVLLFLGLNIFLNLINVGRFDLDPSKVLFRFWFLFFPSFLFLISIIIFVPTNIRNFVLVI